MKFREIVALILVAVLILAPLCSGIIQNPKYSFWLNGASAINRYNAIDIQGWPTFLVSALTLIVLIFQAYIYHRQRELMSQQAEIMSGQLVAAKVAADAAKDSSDSLRLTERAFLGVETIDIKVGIIHKGEKRENFSGIVIRLRNYGKTPANLRELRVFFRALRNEPGPSNEMVPDDITVGEQPTPMLMIGANKTWETPIIYCWDQDQSANARFGREGVFFYAWGHITYRTVFARDAMTTFKLRYDPKFGWTPIGKPAENEGN